MDIRRISSSFLGRLLCAAALATASTAAVAGNVTPVVVEPAVQAPALVWEGFYAGGSLGYASGGDDQVGHRAPSGANVASPGTLNPGGFNYGLRLGWRGERPLESRSFVYGVELGYDGGSIEDDFSTATHNAAVELNGALSLRLRSGFTNESRNTWFYGMLGYTRGDFDYRVSGTAGGDTINLDSGFDSDGWSAGLGAERMLNDNLSLTFEWEYTEFDSVVLFDAGGSSTKATPKYNNFRVGLNFRF